MSKIRSNHRTPIGPDGLTDPERHSLLESFRSGIGSREPLSAVENERRRIKQALASGTGVFIPGIHDFTPSTLGEMLDALENWEGELDTFLLAWTSYVNGQDFPCPEHPAGMHSTWLDSEDSGSCDYCGDKNR